MLKLKDDEKIYYDDLVRNINTYSPTGEIAKRIIEKLDNLIEEIINNNESEDSYNDWEF